jgi:integrase
MLILPNNKIKVKNGAIKMAVYESKQITKDGRKYFFRIKYKDIFGVTHDYSSQKFKTKKEATSEEAKYRIQVENKEICTSSVTIDQIFQEYIEKKSKEVKKQSLLKIKNMYRHLEPIKDWKINEINVVKYNQFVKHIENKHFSVIYSNKILSLFKAIIIYSSKYYNTSDSILKFVDNFKSVNEFKKEMEFYTYDEYIKFRSVIKEQNWKTWFDVLYYLGLRCGECQALQFKDINFNKNTIAINKTLTSKIKGENWTISTPKTKNSIRVLPLPIKLAERIKTMQNNAKKYKDYTDNWFVFGNAIPFKETTIQKRKNDYCDLANLKRIRKHDFRHSCASFLINYCQASASLVSKYLGHGNVSITLNIYTHMYKSELEDISEIINNLENK